MILIKCVYVLFKTPLLPSHLVDKRRLAMSKSNCNSNVALLTERNRSNNVLCSTSCPMVSATRDLPIHSFIFIETIDDNEIMKCCAEATKRMHRKFIWDRIFSKHFSYLL